MRPPTLWTCILDTPWTPAIFYLDIRRIFDAYSTNIRPFRHSLVYFDFSTYERYRMLIAQPLRPITNRIAVHFTFIPSFLPSSLSYHWRLRYFCLYHMDMNYSCDRLLKWWLLHSSHDIPTHFAIFIIVFAYFHLFYIYLTLSYPHKKNRREILPPSFRDHCDFTATATSLWLRFHCDCVLHLLLRILAIDLRPSIAFSIKFLSNFHRIASHLATSYCAPCIVASHIEAVYWKGLPRPRSFIWFICGVCIDHIPII